MRSVLLGLTALLLVPGAAFATSIHEDFENNGPEGTVYNDEELTIDLDAWGSGLGPWIAQTGAPVWSYTAQGGASEDDSTTLPADRAGEFFLTDEDQSLDDGSFGNRDYYFTFGTGVTALSLDLYDYAADGGGQVGDYAELSLYDASKNLLATSTTTVTSSQADLNVLDFTVALNSGAAKYGSLKFFKGNGGGTKDIGVGVDNIKMTVVPEPATMGLLGMGLGGLVLARIRRKRS